MTTPDWPPSANEAYASLQEELREANAALASMNHEWRKDIAALNAEREARKEDLAVIERHSKALRQLDQRIADVLGYCKRHNHSGVNLAAHVYLNRVIEILEGK